MNDRQDETRDLGELAALPPDDPRVRDLDARTRARLGAYREFLAPSGTPPGARVTEADERLRQAIEREIGATTSPAEHREHAAAPDGAARDRGGFLRALFAPAMRPALAAAAVLIVAGALWLAMPQREGGETMRGPAIPAPESGAAFETRATRLAGGDLRLEWAPLPEAERYTVVFLSPKLVEVARVADLTEPHLNLHRGALPSGLRSGDAVLWHAVGMRGSDEVGRTRTSSFTLP